MTTMKNIHRYDLGQIGNVERTPQGFLRVPGFATRTGVFSYKDASGKIRNELRHPDDVFAPESLATLKNVPVTLEHPPKMLDPQNFKQYSKGYTTDRVDINRDLVETDVIIADSEAIDSVEKGERRELSCGYVADLEEESGTFNGAPYNFRQKNIRYNHLAVVKAGRGGPEIRLRMDSEDAVMVEGEEGSGMAKVVFMGQELELPASAAAALQAMIDRYDEMRAQTMAMEAEDMKKDRKDVDISQKGVAPSVPEEQMAPDGTNASKKIGESDTGGAARAKGLDAEGDENEKEDELPMIPGMPAKDAGMGAGGVAMSPMEALKKDFEEMKAKHDAMQAKMDEFASQTMNPKQEPASKMDSKDFQMKLRARVNLERKAERVLPLETVAKFDSMSDTEIYKAVIKHSRPSTDLSDKSLTYLQVRFDSIVEGVEEGAKVRREMGGSLLSRMDSDESDPNAARKKMIQATGQEYKQPLSAVKK